MRKPLIIIGAGGFAREAFCWIVQCGTEPLGFYDEREPKVKNLFGRPVHSRLDDFEGMEFFVAVGDPAVREKLTLKAENAGMKPALPFLHPTTQVGHGLDVCQGSILCPHVVATANIRVEFGCIVNINSTLGHDVILRRFVTIAPGVNVSGHVEIGEGAYIGTNAAIREGVKIGARAVIGMGAVVLKDVPDGAVVYGNPARQRSVKPVS